MAPGEEKAPGTSATSGAVTIASTTTSGECRTVTPATATPMRIATSSPRVRTPKIAIGTQQSLASVGIAKRTIVATPSRAMNTTWTGRIRSRPGRVSPVTPSRGHGSGRFASLGEPGRVVRLVDALVDLGLRQEQRQTTVSHRLLG